MGGGIEIGKEGGRIGCEWVRCALKWVPRIGVFLKYYRKEKKTSELYMKASRIKR